jgi:(2R)-3-sulfolactate dehydrogenase (NADP+)
MQQDDGVRLPGARRAARAAKAQVQGVEIPQALAEQLRALAQ